jgi:F-type H+-transporting ATPase subunit gamma
MPSLRDYRDRISSVKSTRKITSAMKLVAASKLRRAQEQAEAAQPYAKAMAEMMARVAGNVNLSTGESKLLAGTGKDQKHLLVIVTAGRGLCGGFNANLIKEARKQIKSLLSQGKAVSLIFIGRKGHEALKREMAPYILKFFAGVTTKKRMSYSDVDEIMQYILGKFDGGAFDVCSLIYNEFKSVLTQKPKTTQLIPFKIEQVESEQSDDDKAAHNARPYDFEPDETKILEYLLPRNLGVQMFRALLDSAAGEQAARMTAMDNATRNAGEMINDLTLAYNRARQAYITKELIEIISGAEAV